MSWLAPKLKHRIQLQKVVQDPNIFGSFDKEYETLTTIWAGMKETTNNDRFIETIRAQNSDIDIDTPTHEFFVRYAAVKSLGKAFTSGFSSGMDSIEDLNPLKSDYFIFLQSGSSIKGRLFQVLDAKRDDDRKEWFKFRAIEIEERGTGAAE